MSEDRNGRRVLEYYEEQEQEVEDGKGSSATIMKLTIQPRGLRQSEVKVVLVHQSGKWRSNHARSRK